MTDDLVKRLRTSADPSMVHEAADCIEKLQVALMVAAGYISTKEGHTDQHPQDVYDWIFRAALEKNDD